MPEEFAEPTSLNVDQAADFLFQQSAPVEDDEAKDQVEAEDQEVETEQEPEEVEEIDQPEDDSEEDASPEYTDDDLFVEIDGEQYSVSQLKEWRSGGMKAKDYTQKTQALAEREREVETARLAAQENATALQAERAQLQEALASMAIATEPEPNWVELAEKLPPAEVLKQQAAWNQKQAQKRQAAQAFQALQAQQANQTAQREMAALLQQRPDLASPESQQALMGRLQTVGSQYGFAPDEIQAITDHRVILALEALHALQGQAAQVEKAKDVVSKRVVKAEPRRSPKSQASKADADSKALKAKRAKFKKSRGINDAVDLVMAQLNS